MTLEMHGKCRRQLVDVNRCECGKRILLAPGTKISKVDTAYFPLVDRINQKRDQGLDLREAILDGACERLRPILMTGVTTAIGATPLILPLASTTKGEFEGYETFFEQVVTRLETNLKK